MSGGPDDKGYENGADAPRRTLSEIAEDSWNEVIDDAGADDGDDFETPADTRARDASGRFVSREAIPGEQSQDPAPDDEVAPPAQQPIQPPQGVSNEPPVHWSAEDKATFARMPQEGRDFLLRRHGEMERDYQGKVQASASAVNFVQAMAPVFTDPIIDRSLREAGVNPLQAVEQWGAFHKRAMDPNPQVRVDLLKELATKMAVDPAAAFGPQINQPPGNLPPEVQQNPVFRYLTDQISSVVSANTSLRGELESIRSTGERQRQDEMLRLSRQSVDQFADEVDAQGRLLRPHFNTVIPELMTLMNANPNADMRQAYETACYMNPSVRQILLSAGQQTQQQQDNLRRAQNAARSNVRGMTVPVSKPAPPDDGKPKGLRATIMEAADEIGYES